MQKFLTIVLFILMPVTQPALSQTILLGETNLLGIADNGNSGLLLAQGPYTLSQAATINTLSFYTTTVSGQLRLGIYDAGTNHNCKGGSLKAQTNAVTPASNTWNTVNVITPVLLPIGSYCLAYEVSSNTTGFRKGMSTGQSLVYYSKSFGTFPNNFSNNPSTDVNHWSFYATLQGSAPTLSISFNPPSPSIPSDSVGGTIIAAIVPTWSNGNPFTGTVGFGLPNGSDGGTFGIDGSLNLIVSPTGPGVGGDGGTIQNVTITASQ